MFDDRNFKEKDNKMKTRATRVTIHFSFPAEIRILRRQAFADELMRLLEKQRKNSRTYSADESFPGVANVDLRYDLHVQVEQIYIHHHFLVFSSAAILHLGWKGVQTITDIRDSTTRV